MCEKKGDEGESGEAFLWHLLGKSSMETDQVEPSGRISCFIKFWSFYFMC
ncbi:hypothetical protein LguiA_018781 [Lonicera macranthoides]